MNDEPIVTAAVLTDPGWDVPPVADGAPGTVAWLRAHGLAVASSDANFILFGEFGDAHLIWQALLARGVLIRECGPPGWLRVSIGTPGEMAAFRAALRAVLAAARERAAR